MGEILPSLIVGSFVTLRSGPGMRLPSGDTTECSGGVLLVWPPPLPVAAHSPFPNPSVLWTDPMEDLLSQDSLTKPSSTLYLAQLGME